MSKKNATKSAKDASLTSKRGTDIYNTSHSSFISPNHPTSALPSVQRGMPVPSMPPKPSGSPYNVASSLHQPHPSCLDRPSNVVAKSQYISELTDQGTRLYSITPSSLYVDQPMYPNRGVYTPSPLALTQTPDMDAASRASRSRNASTNTVVGRRTPMPPQPRVSTPLSIASARSRSGTPSNQGADPLWMQVPTQGPLPNGLAPRFSVVPTIVQSSGTYTFPPPHHPHRASHVQTSCSPIMVENISATPQVAGVKRDREEDGTGPTSALTKSGNQQSHQRKPSRKRACLPESKPRDEASETHYLGINPGLKLSRPIPAPLLVRSVSNSSLGSHATAFSPSPPTSTPSSQPSLIQTPSPSCDTEGPPSCTGPPAVLQKPIIPCPSPALQYVWDAIDSSHNPMLPPNWNAAAFDAAMERPINAEGITPERTLYPFYASIHDPHGLARAKQQGVSQRELEKWIEGFRGWESQHPKMLASETAVGTFALGCFLSFELDFSLHLINPVIFYYL